MNATSHVARIPCDLPTAKRLSELLSETTEFEGAALCALEEPGGEWRLDIYFSHPPNETYVRSRIAEIDGAAAGALAFERLGPRNWVAESLAGLKPVAAGRFIVHGAHDRARIPRNRIGIEIEASLAFGTGHHGTTRGCLLAIDAIASNRSARRGRGPQRRVLDVGTGTGVLAIAAARAMRLAVVAVDIDPVSVRIARRNARLNAAMTVTVAHAAGVERRVVRARAPYDLILANILLSPLRRMAAPIARIARPGARLVLSGLLDAQGPAAIAAYRSVGFSLLRRIRCEGWTTLVMTRWRASPMQKS